MDLDELYRLLRVAHGQAQGVMNTIRDPLLVLDSDLSVISANPAFYATFDTSRDDTIGFPLYQLGNRQWDIPELRNLLEQVIPKSTLVYDYEVHGEFPVLGKRTMLLSAQRIDDYGSKRRVLLLTIVDATKRVKEANAREVLVQELHHRIKNLFSVTRALATQTSTKDRTADEYRDAFLARFDALGRVQDLVGDEIQDLTKLANTVLEPYFGSRHAITIEGDIRVPLSIKQAQGLGLILHELATNALKYGALSAPKGRILVQWTVGGAKEESSVINLCWQEKQGPQVTPPSAKGFGTRLIDFTAEQDLSGEVEHIYDPNGLIVNLTFPRR